MAGARALCGSLLWLLWTAGVGSAQPTHVGRVSPTAAAATGEPAGPVALSLSWVRLEGAEACPDGNRIARRVEAHLGRGVFWGASEATHAIEAIVDRQASGFRLRVHLQSPAGRRGERALTTTGPGCADLAETAVLVIAALADPQEDPGAVRLTPGVAADLDTAFGSEPAELDPDDLPPPPSRPERGGEGAVSHGAASAPESADGGARPKPAWAVSADVLSTWGASPSTVPGAGLTLTWLAAPGWPVQAAIGAWWPARAEAQGRGSALLYRAGASLRVCPASGERGWLCGGLSASWLLGQTSGFVHDLADVGPALSLGPELHAAYRWPLGAGLALAAGVHLGLSIVRTRLTYAQNRDAPSTVLYQPSLVTAGAQVGLEARF